jgi:large subunit ribosomal protein L10
MPNAKVLESKKAVVAALEEQLKSAQAGVLVDYSGISVEQDTELRNACRQAGVNYGVVKNTMVRRALDEAGLSQLDSVLNGNTSLATGSEDPIAPIKVIADYAKKMGDDKFHIKAAFMEGKVLSDTEIAQMSTLSSKKDLQAQVMGTLLAPISTLAAVIAAIVESKGGNAEAAAE